MGLRLQLAVVWSAGARRGRDRHSFALEAACNSTPSSCPAATHWREPHVYQKPS